MVCRHGLLRGGGRERGKTDEILSGCWKAKADCTFFVFSKPALLSKRKNKNMKNGLCLQGQVILNLIPSLLFFARQHSSASLIQELVGAFYSVLGSTKPLTLILPKPLKLPTLKKRDFQKLTVPSSFWLELAKGLKNQAGKQRVNNKCNNK